MKSLILITLLFLGPFSYAQEVLEHKMQHGFILSNDDSFASHLVATGRHSRQTNITGKLIIHRWGEELTYQQKRDNNQDKTYFVFQAQNLDLLTLKEGQHLKGHIIESKKGDYNPKNIIVNNASFYVDKVLLNIINPFFVSQD